MSEVRRGLAGVVADTTAISEQDGELSRLTYRGYPVQELAARCGYEQVAHLLLHGELPDSRQLAAFCARERELRELTPMGWEVLRACHPHSHPLDVLRTVLSAQGAELRALDPGQDDVDVALGLIAATPTVIAHHAALRAGRPPRPPDEASGLAENLLGMCFGGEVDPPIARAFEMSLILYAELGFNASTFTCRAIISTGADLSSGIVGAIAALSGPLHGAANEQVWRTMETLGDAGRVAEWVDQELTAGRRVTGFGHRVFRRRDPRAAPMRTALGEVAGPRDGERVVRLHDALVEAMASAKGIPPNVDLAAGPAYHLMGFDTDMFSALFAVGRMAGWCAHAIEQRSRSAIVHPLAEYVGEPPREVPS